MRRLCVVLSLTASLFATVWLGPAEAVAQQAPGDVLDMVFSDTEKRLIREYFGTASHDDGDRLPPGLAKKDKLPPGIAKKLRRDGSLPPGLAKRSLPDDLASRLPKRKGGFEPVIVDSDVVLIEKVTGRVLDIVAGAAKPEAKPSRR